ncbi:LysM peptidoglycan-binding domain-containing protein [Microbacterium sp. SORGH_AS_0888]|uniref:LysM peptidoglycan-binding domain-containing protein n=1 Tax=Microbacterium sp. SORGH_AS_0888 TaxID=3041791 RepID=UPI002786BB55|nr:LysM peptidoglycan-binding domain-containing protein [Microbacterium sp. SORGH_AS_0888]MDQ1129070.1 putative membrane protein [Microbacterium sp. SORGH_AS_0888]
MSTIQYPAPAVSTVRLRLTPRGRRVIAALAATPIVIAIGAAVLFGGSALASGEQGASTGSFQTVTVLAGESLWSIAEEVAPNADPRDVVADIMRLNALDDSDVSAGARIAIPAEYAQR